jgi:hypothetical protein
VASIDSTELRQIFDLLGRGIRDPIEVYIAGSIPTLIKGLTARPTLHIDFVDEVPAEIRSQRAVLRTIETDFGLTLGHVNETTSGVSRPKRSRKSPRDEKRGK